MITPSASYINCCCNHYIEYVFVIKFMHNIFQLSLSYCFMPLRCFADKHAWCMVFLFILQTLYALVVTLKSITCLSIRYKIVPNTLEATDIAIQCDILSINANKTCFMALQNWLPHKYVIIPEGRQLVIQ